MSEAMMPLDWLAPSRDELVRMDVEEVALLVLEHLREAKRSDGRKYDWWGHLNRQQFHTALQRAAYSTEQQRAVMEGWSWLEREGLIERDSQQGGDWVVISRRGEQVRSTDALRGYRESRRFPATLLHATIVAHAWPEFRRGDYDTAVFKAFRDLEISVREVARLDASDIGVNLMRKAFGDGGPLEDAQDEKSERQALRELFAGAIGRFKNPQSHRHVALTEPVEAFQMLVLASLLMRFVDDRRGQIF